MAKELWTEKYRPKTLDDIKGQSMALQQIKEKLKQGEITSLILKGPTGVGKTTTAKVIAKVIFQDDWKMNFKELNAGDKRKLDDIRKLVGDYMKYAPWGNHRFKILLLDKAESIMKDSQEALERMMEDWGNNCRLILCVNDVERIETTIRSRCTEYQFMPISDKDIAERLKEIAAKENLKISDADIMKVVSKSKNDLRKAINNLQMGNYSRDASDELFA
jgi:replication factor C small subunit